MNLLVNAASPRTNVCSTKVQAGACAARPLLQRAGGLGASRPASLRVRNRGRLTRHASTRPLPKPLYPGTKKDNTLFFEDARSLTPPAVELLESQKIELGCPDLKIWSLVEFTEYARHHTLTRRQKETIVNQAILLIDQFYAHLPFKRARYAADPVQGLRLVRAQLDSLSDLAFHEQMIQALVSLRDAHTFYSLPFPYKGAFAFLPFRMECFHEPGKFGQRRYIVTHILDGFDHQLFTVDAEITSWNGVPVDQAIERDGQEDVGGNQSSRLARSINRSCTRSLALAVPPRESFVVLNYVPVHGPRDEYGIVMPWYIATSGIISKPRKGSSSSLNESMAQAARVRQMLFHRQESAATPPSQPDLQQQSNYPHVFSFQYAGGIRQPQGVDGAVLHNPAQPDRKFGYLRIWTFDLDPADTHASDKFTAEFQRIAALMQNVAPDGLILDVRSNPGGSIDAAERILQCLTPKPIQPAAFHFICSETTQRIASVLHSNNRQGAAQANQREWLPWIDDLLSSVTTGEAITPGRPLTSPEQANDTGQIYQGPVTLIIDAMAYSATDIFSAGFQDHAIGKIIGVDLNTGGGGANRWLHEELHRNLQLHGLHDVPIEALPAGAGLGLAIRRSSRVADNRGNAIEDDGVKADITYRLTRQDLLNNDCDLLAFACAHLAAQPIYFLKILNAELGKDSFQVTVSTRNLFRLECLVNDCIQIAVPVNGPAFSFQVPVQGILLAPQNLQINGFARVPDSVGILQLQFVATDSRLFDSPLQTDSTTVTAAAG